MTLEDLFRHAEVAADAAYFVFEEIFERLDELELHLLGQAAYVLVRLDDLRRAADGTGFDHVWIEGALHEPLDVAFGLQDAMRFVVEELR